MPSSQGHIGAHTPMGANLTADGVTFRVWAPRAEHVFVAFEGAPGPPGPDEELVKDPVSGHWTGFFQGVGAGARYRFLVSGPSGSGLKRDPRARELDFTGPPDCACVVTD